LLLLLNWIVDINPDYYNQYGRRFTIMQPPWFKTISVRQRFLENIRNYKQFNGREEQVLILK